MNYTLICCDGNMPMYYDGKEPNLQRKDVAKKHVYLRMTMSQANDIISYLGSYLFGVVVVRTLLVMDIGMAVDLDPTLVEYIATRILEENDVSETSLNDLYLKYVSDYCVRNV